MFHVLTILGLQVGHEVPHDRNPSLRRLASEQAGQAASRVGQVFGQCEHRAFEHGWSRNARLDRRPVEESLAGAGQEPSARSLIEVRELRAALQKGSDEVEEQGGSGPGGNPPGAGA